MSERGRFPFEAGEVAGSDLSRANRMVAMGRSPRSRATLFALERLEARSLLTVAGNQGFLHLSQFQAGGFPRVAAQWRLLTAHGPVSIGTDAETSGPVTTSTHASNTGNIVRSQFADASFSAFGVQWEKVSLGNRLSVIVAGSTLSAGTSGSTLPGAATNSGDIIHTQFHDGGFGDLGFQWRRVQVGGDFRASALTIVRNPDGTPAGPTTMAPTVRGPASVNTGLIRDAQFNDGGFGKVGLQFRGVRVRGSVGVGMVSWLIPATNTDRSSIPARTASRDDRTTRVLDATNTGVIRDAQFNDGGFGDIGFQWSKVGIRRNVVTSSNSLSIQPEAANIGAITATDLVFGRGRPSDTATPTFSPATTPGVVAAMAATSLPTTQNDATNSGLLTRSQFNDGGFGDIGLQWRAVHVAGGVSAVHNSLSVQPENAGQGRITVNHIRFPSTPAPQPGPTPAAKRSIPDNRTPIRRDGQPVTTPLPDRTRPFDTTIAKNEATNSGDIIGSQFNDGGFGDVGMQWQDVRVRGKVRVVHNSLSIQPEGSNLAGVDVSDVAFGDPSGAVPARTRRVQLISRELTGTAITSVYLEWDHVSRRHGLLIVNNILEVAAGTSAVIEDVRFPGPSPAVSTLAIAADTATPVGSQVANAATNSGILLANQFNDGGFGDVGLQWRKIRISGPVTVVHNSLSIKVTGTSTGPINVANIAFASGALDGLVTTRVATGTVAPRESPHRATNDGLLIGGQFSAGGLGHVALRWRKVDVHGPVTILDNILSVKSTEPAAGPITIRHVAFA